jgi:hypothetical protein
MRMRGTQSRSALREEKNHCPCRETNPDIPAIHPCPSYRKYNELIITETACDNSGSVFEKARLLFSAEVGYSVTNFTFYALARDLKFYMDTRTKMQPG